VLILAHADEAERVALVEQFRVWKIAQKAPDLRNIAKSGTDHKASVQSCIFAIGNFHSDKFNILMILYHLFTL
jgi:hypothetical protein